MTNCLPLKFDTQSREFAMIVKEFGAQNVETVLICIAEQRTPKGLRVHIPPTYELLREVLEAMHGRNCPGCTGTGKHWTSCSNQNPLKNRDGWPEAAVKCGSCGTRAVVDMDGSMTCLYCGRSKEKPQSGETND